MGSFNVICNLSGVPIRSGDPAMAVFLMPRRRWDCDISIFFPADLFMPIFAPVVGTYDDYGALENVAECVNTLLIKDQLADAFKRRDLKWKPEPEALDNAQAWVRRAGRGTVTMRPMPNGLDRKSEHEPLSFSMVSVEAFYLLADSSSIETRRENADEWLEWYFKLKVAAKEWEPNRGRFLFDRWGEAAVDHTVDGLYVPVPPWKDRPWPGNPFLSFFDDSSRNVDQLWMKAVYFHFLEKSVEAGIITTANDERWISLRDSLVDMQILDELMARLHRTWTPMVVGEQDDDAVFLEQVSAKLAEFHRKRAAEREE